MRVAIYCRVSIEDKDKDQDNDNDKNKRNKKVKKVKTNEASLENQQARCKAYIKAKDWELARIFVEDKSAKDLKRPAIQCLFQDVEDKKIDAVIITRLDRMFRDTKDFLDKTEFFQQHNCMFICLDGEIDTTTPNGKLFATMRAAFAQFERETIAGRVTEGMMSRATRGLWNGGPLPYGYQHRKE